MARRGKKKSNHVVDTTPVTNKKTNYTKGGDPGSRGRSAPPTHIPGPGESGR